jgi:hypothetical protein
MAKPGRPMCREIPPALKNWATARGLSMREIAMRIDKSEGWINGMFKGDQERMRPYCLLADYSGLTVDDIVIKIRKREMSKFIESLKVELSKRTGAEINGLELARTSGVSDGLLRKLAKDNGDLGGLKSYVILAEFTGLKIHQFRKDGPLSRIA